MPDSPGVISLMTKTAIQMASEHRLDEFRKVCEKAAGLPFASSDKWMR
jgi:hypothetical protein